MSGFSAGIATFASCNKAGSIPHFTEHLRQNPADYNALIWRGKAYSIIEKKPQARADFTRAANVSSGARKALAECEVADIDGDTSRVISIAQQTVKDYPACEDAWGQFGTVLLAMQKPQEAFEALTKAVSIAEENNRTKEPSYCWNQHERGLLLLNSVYIDEALTSFKAGVNSCETHTISYLGLSRANIVKGEEQRAKDLYLKAKSLNHTLVDWTTFENFRDEFNKTCGTELRQKYLLSKQTAQARISTSESSGDKEAAGTSGGGRGGGGGGGSGSDDDGDDDDGKWKQIKKESPCIMKDKRGISYVQSKDEKQWYSRDKAGHAGSFVKVFENTRSFLVFKGSLDRNMKPISAKHESKEGTTIRKSHLDVVIKR